MDDLTEYAARLAAADDLVSVLAERFGDRAPAVVVWLQARHLDADEFAAWFTEDMLPRLLENGG